MTDIATPMLRGIRFIFRTDIIDEIREKTVAKQKTDCYNNKKHNFSTHFLLL